MWAAPGDELSHPAAPPCSRSRSLRVGRRRVRPVARRRRSRNVAGPTGTGTRPVAFVERDDIAVQAVGRRETTGRQRGGVHPGCGRKDRAVVGVPARGRREAVQVRSERFVHVVAAQAVDHDEYRTPLTRHANFRWEPHGALRRIGTA